MMRILLSALLAGIAMFAWQFIAHMILPVGETGVQALPSEAAVMTALHDNVREPGFYFFPAPEDRPGMTAEQKQQALSDNQRKWLTGPAGILVFHPDGFNRTFPVQLLTQFATAILAMLVAAILLSRIVAARYWSRVLLAGLLGLLPVFQSEAPAWNWYGFPTSYTLSQLLVHVVGFLVGGLVLAGMARPPLRAVTAVSAS